MILTSSPQSFSCSVREGHKRSRDYGKALGREHAHAVTHTRVRRARPSRRL